jgi:nicotinate-nucleotide adenylyltransferase
VPGEGAGRTQRPAIGLFGGTFDPVHFAHLRLATELAEAFGLERVVFLPNGVPYHRGRDAHATAEQRLAMLRAALEHDARFEIDERELHRSGPTYTYDTLTEIRRERGAGMPIVFLTGTDAFAKIDTWHRWTEVFELAHFGVAIRAHDAAWLGKGLDAFPQEARARITTEIRDVLDAPAGKVMAFRMTQLDISSTSIRALAGAGASMRYLTPDPVIDYIRTHNLYAHAPEPRRAAEATPR